MPIPQGTGFEDTISYSTDVVLPDGTREFFSMTIRVPAAPAELDQLVQQRAEQWKRARQLVRTALGIGNGAPETCDDVRLKFPKSVAGMTIGHVLDTLGDVGAIRWVLHADATPEAVREACAQALEQRGLDTAPERGGPRGGPRGGDYPG